MTSIYGIDGFHNKCILVVFYNDIRGRGYVMQTYGNIVRTIKHKRIDACFWFFRHEKPPLGEM